MKCDKDDDNNNGYTTSAQKKEADSLHNRGGKSDQSL